MTIRLGLSVALLAGCGTSAAHEPPSDAGTDSAIDAPWDGASDAPLDTGEDADAKQPVDATQTDAAEAGSSGPLRIAVLADLNGSYGSTSYGTAVHDAVQVLVTYVRPDIVLLAGDLVAGQKPGLDYAAMWSAFHQAVTMPLLQHGIPVAVTPGNHDASAYAGYELEREEFIAQWSTPERIPDVAFVDDSEYPLRYSFVYRGVFFLSLDATRVGSLGAPQRTWVEQQLAGADAYPVKIAFGHLPLRAVAHGVETQVLGDDALASTFTAHGVTAYVSGHHHAYYPGVTGGLWQLATGCLGAGPRALIGDSAASSRSFLTIDVANGAELSAEGWAAPAFDVPVDRALLPTAITYDGHTVVRDDLHP